MTTLLTTGIVHDILQNVEYALPARPCYVISPATVQVGSELGGSFADLATPITADNFVKCATGDTTILLKPA